MTLKKLLEHTCYTQEIEVRIGDAIDGDLIFIGVAWQFTVNDSNYEKYAKKRIKILVTYENRLVIELR